MLRINIRFFGIFFFSDLWSGREGPTDTLPVGPQSFNQITDLKNQLTTTNFGVDGSIGLEYLIGKAHHDKIFFKTVGNYGFLNIQKGIANGKNNTGAATLMLDYAYKMGK